MPTFSDPGTGGDRLPLDDLLGALLLFTVHEHVRDIETTFGTSDAIRCDVAALDGANKSETWTDTLIFPRVLQSQLRGVVSRPDDERYVLGRLDKGTAKKGQSPPWTLEAATDDDKATATKYLEYVAAQFDAEEEPF